jgi:hypothetical protein
MCELKYKLLVFSWNTESISLSETMDKTVFDFNRSSYSSVIPGITSWKYSSEMPDFYPELSKKITEGDIDIVVIGFQEDRYPGSYFHSHFLPEEMDKIGYTLIKRTKLMGLGVTSYKGLLKGDMFERGIRVSIYAKNSLAPVIEKEESEMRKAIGNDGQSEYICSNILTRSKGATVSYLCLPGIERIAFVCCHLPFNSHSLIKERIYHNTMIRQTELNKTNTCFNNIVENLVLFVDPQPKHVIYFGDFNYRVEDSRSAVEIASEFIKGDKEFIKDMYINHDELKEQMNRKNIYEYSEGIDNRGPEFIPTCKMIKGRTEDKYWKTGKFDQRIPSWCDRILYTSGAGESAEITRVLKCVEYDRFDFGEAMKKSDHAAVLGIFYL